MCLGIPAQITLIINADTYLASVSVGESSRNVNIGCVCEPDADIESLIGQWVLLHLGFAMRVIDEDQALQTLALLQQLNRHIEVS